MHLMVGSWGETNNDQGDGPTVHMRTPISIVPVFIIPTINYCADISLNGNRKIIIINIIIVSLNATTTIATTTIARSLSAVFGKGGVMRADS